MKTTDELFMTEAKLYQLLYEKAQQTLETVCREYRKTDLCRKKLYRKKK